MARLKIETRRVLLLHSKGHSVTKIREMLSEENVSVTRQALYTFLKRGEVVSPPRRGNGRRKLRPVHRQFINMWLSRNPALTAESLRQKLRATFSVTVSSATVSKARRNLGWKAYGGKYGQLIGHKNKLARMQWCCDAWEKKEDFKDVIFADESSVEMNSHGRLFFHRSIHGTGIQKDPAKRAKPKHAYKVHVWGGISYRGRTSICIFTGIMNSGIYQQSCSITCYPLFKTDSQRDLDITKTMTASIPAKTVDD